jgi:hypothetical protein
MSRKLNQTFQFALLGLILGFVWSMWSKTEAASDIVQGPFQIFTVGTNVDTVLNVPDNFQIIKHLNYQSDGTTPSQSGDYVIISGASIGNASLADGAKVALFTGDQPISFRGLDVPAVNGTRSLYFRASSTHSAKLAIMQGARP